MQNLCRAGPCCSRKSKSGRPQQETTAEIWQILLAEEQCGVLFWEAAVVDAQRSATALGD
jgi:hypothetical protein